MMKHPDQYAGIFCFLLGGAITISSFSYGVGSLSEPGPGFITFLAGAVLTVLSLILFIASGKSKERFHGLSHLWEGRQTKKVFMILALLAAYMFLLTPIGFLLATFFLLLSPLSGPGKLCPSKGGFLCGHGDDRILYHFRSIIARRPAPPAVLWGISFFSAPKSAFDVAAG